MDIFDAIMTVIVLLATIVFVVRLAVVSVVLVVDYAAYRFGKTEEPKRWYVMGQLFTIVFNILLVVLFALVLDQYLTQVRVGW